MNNLKSLKEKMKYRKFIAWLTFFGSIASVLGVFYIFYPRDNSKIGLDFILSNCDNLTVFNTTGEPEIEATFEYKGERINKLWKLNISIINATNKTIIGYGQTKNLMFNNLMFFVKNDFKIIDKKLIHSDFNHNLSIASNDTIILDFKQWRFRERLDYSFYLTTDSENVPDIAIFHQPEERQIIDGDISFLRKVEDSEKILITNSLGIPTKTVIYIIFILMCVVVLFFLVWITICNPIGHIQRYIWKKKYLLKYNDFIKQKGYDKLGLLDNPQRFAKWNECDIPVYVEPWGPDFQMEKVISVIAITFVFAILSFVQVILIIDIIQFFP
jgi:hypothetical protein